MSNSLLALIGNTPLVLSNAINTNPNVKLYFKLEGQNPGGSVKDRPAYNMIKSGLDRGDFDKDTKLIEATSGNTGIGLAMVAGLFGLTIELVMPENSTIERVKTMEAYGAKVTLTPAEIGIEGARDYVLEKVANDGFKMLDQFGNEDNWKAHYKTTGPEIWRDTEGAVTHFISSMGTTGTITGTSTYLKEQNPNISIVGVQPKEGARIPGIRKWSPEYVPSIYKSDKVDDILYVSEEEAIAMTKRLAHEEGIFAGMSSGGAAVVAAQIAANLESGTIVSIVCDRGDRYLSSDIYK
ncbi:cysteine synthase CysM [Flavobacterium sp. ASW18X]|uniref:cysteine synthase CysM n=1 Tax=Flavobacterium sp. ASW18X TaxID=2572595 RepID=UPI0010AE7F12|nr:cysteine synthase CysM [Flavobacterium sp. ASW18X]TKD66096.1 cysteine synthase CysM [Flavobacterium sp. ASW18X]